MTLSYAAFYFVPQPQTNAIPIEGSWNVSLNLRHVPACQEEVSKKHNYKRHVLQVM